MQLDSFAKNENKVASDSMSHFTVRNRAHLNQFAQV